METKIINKFTLRSSSFHKKKKIKVGRSQWLKIYEKNMKQVQLFVTYGLMVVHKVKILIDLGATENILSNSVIMKSDLMLMKDVSE